MNILWVQKIDELTAVAATSARYNIMHGTVIDTLTMHMTINGVVVF